MAAIYRVSADDSIEMRRHIGVPLSGADQVKRMLDCAAVRETLVALYLPERTPEDYEPGLRRGRVVGIAKVQKLPRGKKIEDYGYQDLEGAEKWPIGFPCSIVCHPSNVKDCPSLRELIELSGEPLPFHRFVRELHLAPVRLSGFMQSALSEQFENLKWAS
jgi:hypothetical protein